MKTKDWFWAVIEAVIWYTFIYYLLYAIKNPVNLWRAAVALLVLFYLGTVTCPWVRQSQAWKRLWEDN